VSSASRSFLGVYTRFFFTGRSLVVVFLGFWVAPAEGFALPEGFGASGHGLFLLRRLKSTTAIVPPSVLHRDFHGWGGWLAWTFICVEVFGFCLDRPRWFLFFFVVNRPRMLFFCF